MALDSSLATVLLASEYGTGPDTDHFIFIYLSIYLTDFAFIYIIHMQVVVKYYNNLVLNYVIGELLDITV